MTTLWKDIIKEPSFQAQPDKVRLDVAGNYFKRHIETDTSFKEQSGKIRDEVRTNFMDSALSIQPPADSGPAPPTPEIREMRTPGGVSTIGPAEKYDPAARGGLASPPEVPREVMTPEQERFGMGAEPKKYENFGHVIGGIIQGTVEGAATLATGVPAFVGSTLGTGMGILTTLVKEGKIDAQTLADAKDVQEQMMESLTYAPNSEEGEMAAALLAMPFTLASEGVYSGAKRTGATEDQARAAQFLLDAALVFGPKIKGGLKRAGKTVKNIAQMPREVRESIAALGTEKLREAEIAPEAPKVPKEAPKAPEGKLVEALASETGAITLKRTPIRDAMDAEGSPTANKVQKVFDEQRQATIAAGKMKPEQWLKVLNRAIVDVSGNAKNRLLKEAGKEGQKAVMEHDLIAGASAKANMEVGTVIDSMTKGLTREQYEYMNDYIQAKRALAISAYKKEFKHAGDIKGNEYVQWMENLPEEVRGVLEERSQIFFDTMQKKLGELRDEGLISEESYQNLVEKGDYAPRKLQKYLEVEDSGQFGGKKISVEGAGIKKLKEGDIGLLENDAELMLREVVGRFEHRIARNRANRALYDVAKANPENGIITIGKIKTEFLVRNKATDKTLRKFRDPEKARQAKSKYKKPEDYEIVRRDVPRDKLPPDKDYVNVVVEGKTVPLVLDREFTRDWVSRETVIDPNVANLMQWASGSKILRPMATGINPAFAITNLPRDMARALIVSEEFSPHLPVGLVQLGREMAAVTADSFTRKGRYKDFINEGGGMSFLTHQGQTFKPGSSMAKAGEYLGYIGETSEIMVRLAIRERAVRNRLKREGKVTPERMKEIQREATYEARNQLDFSQGGWLTKAVDNSVPYLNAAVQGTRGMFRAAKNNPSRFAYQIGQIGALASGLYYMNYFLNGEAYEQISDRDKANNWIITTPWHFTDNQGNKRYYFVKIPKDQSQRVFASMFEGFSAKVIGEDVNEDMIVQTVTDLTPVGPTDFLPPTVEAALGYVANKDFWRNEDIWKSKYAGQVEPEEEYTTYTPEFFKQAGQVTGMSPERLRYALSQVFTHGNIYTDLGGYLWKQTLDNMTDDEQKRTTEQMILNKPGIRRLLEATEPYYAQEKQVKEAKTAASTKRLKQNRELDSLSQQYINKTIDGSALINFINKAEPEDRRRLLKRHKRRVKLQDLPNRRWWMDVAEMDPESRAIEFYRVYKDSSKKEKQEMRFNAQKVDGMTSERFRKKVIQLMREGKK